MSGARRQIFMAFGGFLLVERFGYDLSAIATLMLATYSINIFAAPMIGAMIGRLGERLTIQIENISLIAVFFGYALASQGLFGASGGLIVGLLFIVDGIFVTLIIAQKTYFQKIADRPTHFYMIGSMGNASAIALGVALAKPNKQVITFDGDGNVLMGMGTLATVGALKPKISSMWCSITKSTEPPGISRRSRMSCRWRK
ncbi:MAG: hypothetical protein HC794_05625 [Nitrospiraceae bacterium]|nr:hypothetical protein [Nitrospiraceae bacterium]